MILCPSLVVLLLALVALLPAVHGKGEPSTPENSALPLLRGHPAVHGEPSISICDRTINQLKRRAKPVRFNPITFMEYVKGIFAQGDTVILTTTDYLERRIFLNWYFQMKNLNLEDSLVVVTADQKMHELLDLLKISHFPANLSSSSRIGKLRMKALTLALCAERNVVISEADAIWLKNPINDIFHGGNWDLALTFEKPSKPNWQMKWTGCFGLSFWKFSQQMLQFISLVNSLTRFQQDDQSATNHAVEFAGITDDWTLKEDGSFAATTNFPKLKVGIISEELIVRDCKDMAVSSAYVAHCISRDHEKIKEFAFKTMHKLWFLSDTFPTGIKDGELIVEAFDREEASQLLKNSNFDFSKKPSNLP